MRLLTVRDPALLASGGEEAPTPPTTNDLLLWLVAEDLALANNDPVSSWVDRSANAWDMTQGNPAERPIFKTNRINGYPTVASDGDSDKLIYFGGPITSTNDNWCMWGVFNRNRATSGPGIVFASGSNSGYTLAMNTASSGDQGALYGAVAWFHGTSASTSGVFEAWIMARRSGTMKLWIGGGTHKLSTGTAPNSASTGPQLFTDSGLTTSDGETPECGIYERALTDAEIDELGTYMTDKYALTAWTPI